MSITLQELKNDPIINGLLISDAYLRKPQENHRNSYFELTQVEKNSDYVVETDKHLKKLGFRTKISHRKRYDKRTKKTYYSIIVRSQTSPVLTKLYKLWYPNSKKVVPKFLKLSSECIAWWFMGDGYSSWIPHREKKVMVGFSTNSFTKEENENLIHLLNDLGYHPWINGKDTKTNIIITKSDDVKNLMTEMESYVFPCFQYKIKYPLVRTISEAKTGIPNKRKGIQYPDDFDKTNFYEGQGRRRKREREIVLRRICDDCGSRTTRNNKNGFPSWIKVVEKSNAFRCQNCYRKWWKKQRKKLIITHYNSG